MASNKGGLVGGIAGGLLAFFIWRNPGGTASDVSHFLGSAAHWLGEAWDRIGEFLKGLSVG